MQIEDLKPILDAQKQQNKQYMKTPLSNVDVQFILN